MGGSCGEMIFWKVSERWGEKNLKCQKKLNKSCFWQCLARIIMLYVVFHKIHTKVEIVEMMKMRKRKMFSNWIIWINVLVNKHVEKYRQWRVWHYLVRSIPVGGTRGMGVMEIGWKFDTEEKMWGRASSFWQIGHDVHFVWFKCLMNITLRSESGHRSDSMLGSEKFGQ